jgi:hypothetical protein
MFQFTSNASAFMVCGGGVLVLYSLRASVAPVRHFGRNLSDQRRKYRTGTLLVQLKDCTGAISERNGRTYESISYGF